MISKVILGFAIRKCYLHLLLSEFIKYNVIKLQFFGDKLPGICPIKKSAT